jgi:O-antigen ligase
LHFSKAVVAPRHRDTEALNRAARSIETTNGADPQAFSAARILLVAALIGAPWAFGAVDSWAWMSLGLVASVLLLLWAVGSVQQGVLKFVWSPLYIPLGLFLLLGFVQYGARLALDRWETRTALVLFAANLTFFFVSVQLFSGARAKNRHRFGLAVLLFAGVMGLFSILQFASGAQKIYWSFDTSGSFFGPYGNRDHYAGLMEMLIPVAAFSLAERLRSVAAMALPGLAVTIAVSSLLLSGSRSGVLALAVEVIIAVALGAWHARTTRRSERHAPVAHRSGVAASFITLTAVLLFSCLLFAWVDTGEVVKRLGAVASPGDTWAEWSSFRRSVALDSLRMLRDHSVIGIGLGNFETAYPQYQSFPTDLTVDYAHNDYAEAIAETGLAGAVLIFAALALFFRLAFRNWGRRLSSGDDWIAMGAAVGCCGLLVHSFFDFNLHIPANAAWFAVLAGIATTDEPAPRRA